MRSCAAAITMRFAACHIHCFANHNGSNAQNRRGPSGDHARRSPFWRLWVLRLPLQRARGPPATTRAAGPSAVSGHCIALQIPMAVTRRTAGGPAAISGDHARRRPFWRLWVLRLPLQTRRRPFCSLWTLHCFANPSGSNAQNRRGPSTEPQGAQRRPRAPQSLLEALGTAPATAKSEGPSGDHARRRPFCSLWTLRRSPFCSLWTLRREPESVME